MRVCTCTCVLDTEVLISVFSCWRHLGLLPTQMDPLAFMAAALMHDGRLGGRGWRRGSQSFSLPAFGIPARVCPQEEVNVHAKGPQVW